MHVAYFSSIVWFYLFYSLLPSSTGHNPLLSCPRFDALRQIV